MQKAGVEPFAGIIVALVMVVFGIERDTRPTHGVVAKAWLALRTVVVSSEATNASPVEVVPRKRIGSRDLRLLIGYLPKLL